MRQRHTIGKLLKNQGLLHKLILTNVIVIFLPLVLMGIIMFRNFYASIEEKVGDFQKQYNVQITNNLDTYMIELDRLTLSPYQDPDVMKYVQKNKDKNEALTFEEREVLGDFVTRLFINGRIDVVGVSLFGHKGASVTALPESPFTRIPIPRILGPWLEKADQEPGKSVFISTHTINSRNNKPFEVFSVARQLRKFQTMEPTGYIILDIDIKVIDRLLNRVTFGDQKQMILMDQNGDVVYQNGDQKSILNLPRNYSGNGVEKREIEGKDWLVAYSQSSVTGWTTISLVPVKELLSETYKTRNFIIIVGMGCFILAIILSFVIALMITRPIRNLRALMKKVQSGDLNVAFPVVSKDEIGQLGHSFNVMVSNLNDLAFRLYETEIREKNSQIAALQSKINPHFLYNTLGSISMYATVQGNQEVVMMTNNLAKLLRYTLSPTGRHVLVKQEIEHVKGYLAIQKIRYEDRLVYEIDIDESVAAYPTIPLLLQPIAENAINHGIDKGSGKGTVTITGKFEGNKLVFRIEDNGIGMSESELHYLRRRLDTEMDSEGVSGNGLINVHRGIVLHYGNMYGLTLDSQLGEGMCVTLTIPAMER